MSKKKKILPLVISSLLVLCLAAAAISAISNAFLPAGPEDLSVFDPLDKARLEEALHLKDELGDSVWPGLSAARIPVIVHNREYSFLALSEEAPEGWSVLDGETISGLPVYRQPSDDPQNFAVPLGDGWAASIATKSETDQFMIGFFKERLPPVIEQVFPYRLVILPSEVQICGTLHEAYHAFTAIQVPDRLEEAEAAHRLNEKYEAKNPVMRDFWKEEFVYLVDALKAEDDDESARYARMFLSNRAERRNSAGLSAQYIEYERLLEWEEGLAKYVEMSFWKAASQSPDYQPVESVLADPGFQGFEKYNSRWNQVLIELNIQANQDSEIRFYNSGMAQAFLLDRFAPGWKESAFEEGVWLEDLLAKALE